MGPYVNMKGRSNQVPTAFLDADYSADVVAKYKVDAVPFFIVVTKEGVKHKQAGSTHGVVDNCIKIVNQWR